MCLDSSCCCLLRSSSRLTHFLYIGPYILPPAPGLLYILFLLMGICPPTRHLLNSCLSFRIQVTHLPLRKPSLTILSTSELSLHRLKASWTHLYF